MSTILVTGFDPFGGDSDNPSWAAAQAIAAGWDGTQRVVARRLPVDFTQADVALAAALAETQPSLVVCFGVAVRRDLVTPERFALNIDDARIPDNAGSQPRGEPIDAAGPAALISTLPLADVVAAFAEAGVAAQVSNHAGTYVCNHVFYRLMQWAGPRGVPAGFIHLPPGRTPAPALVAAVRVCLPAK